jgi:hypothetical protein
MTTLAKLRKVAEPLGCIVVQDRAGETVECTVEAPAGFCFGSGLHMFVDMVYLPWKPDYTDLIARVNSEGIEKCTVEGCDWCNDRNY